MINFSKIIIPVIIILFIVLMIGFVVSISQIDCPRFIITIEYIDIDGNKQVIEGTNLRVSSYANSYSIFNRDTGVTTQIPIQNSIVIKEML